MANNVIRLVPVDDQDGPHWSGEASCGACGHEWIAVAPVGDEDHLECPNCHRCWGAAKHAFPPPAEQWKCGCGNSLFWLTPQGAMCRRCGVISSEWAS